MKTAVLYTEGDYWSPPDIVKVYATLDLAKQVVHDGMKLHNEVDTYSELVDRNLTAYTYYNDSNNRWCNLEEIEVIESDNEVTFKLKLDK